MKHSFFALLLLVGFCLPGTANAQKLTYKLSKGHTFEMNQKVISTIKQTMQGMTQNVDMNVDGSQSFKVAELTSTGYKIEVRYLNLSSSVGSMAMNLDISSEGDQSESANRLMKSMVDVPFFLFLAKNGEIEKFEGHENLRTSVDKALETMSLQEKMAMLPMLEGMISESALKKAFAQAFVVFPDQEMKKGLSWDQESQAPGQMEATINQTFTVETVSAETVTLKVDGKVKTTDPEKVTKMNGINILYDLAGGLKGSYEINVKTGLISKATNQGAMDGNMTLKAGGQIPEDMLVPMEISTETTLTVK